MTPRPVIRLIRVRTIQHAADTVQPGENVYVLAGDYQGFAVESKADTEQALGRDYLYG